MLLIFDLDGTLIDSAEDLAIAMNATRQHMQLAPLDPKLIYSYVGNGAAVLVRRALGPDATDAEAGEALQFFLKFYRTHALQHTKLYPGIAELLGKLRKDRHALAVLTNKPQRISADILAALRVDRQFIRIYGGDSFRTKKPDPIGITTLLTETRAKPNQAVMIGDSPVDVETAKNAGIRCCGVSWGFQPEELSRSGPDMTIKSPDQLIDWIAQVS